MISDRRKREREREQLYYGILSYICYPKRKSREHWHGLVLKYIGLNKTKVLICLES